MELIFEVIARPAGGFSAECLNARIGGTGGDTLEALHDAITSAVDQHFGDGPKPPADRIHLLFYREDLA